MKKVLLPLVGMILGAGVANAQLPVGSIVPDFTATDINGVSHNLYSYLDSGYSVIVDNSATWCGPCWNVHQSHVLKTLFEEYGPTGTVTPKKIMVLFIESDNSTTLADLNGTTAGTQGDWVTGTPYPIIDNSSFNTMFAVSGYPTFTMICPNRMVTFATAGYSSAMLNKDFWIPKMTSCPVKVTGTNVGVISTDVELYQCVDGSAPIKARIQNIGTNPLTSANLTAKVDGVTVASTTYSGSLSTYGYADVTIGNYTVPAGTKDIVIEATTTGDVVATDNSKTTSVMGLGSNYKSWTIQVKTDNYPGETSWKLKNSAGAEVAGASYTAGTGSAGAGGPDAKKLFEYPVTLAENECYTFEVLDTYGDGLYGASVAADTGYIKIMDGDNNLLFNIGAGYDEGMKVNIKSGTVMSITDVINENSIEIYPVPVNDVVNIKMNASESFEASIDIVNVTGQVMTNKVQTLNAGSNVITISTVNLPAGLYMVNIKSNDGTISRKFVKK